MQRSVSTALLTLLMLQAPTAFAQSAVGTEPSLRLGARDIFKEFGVPKPANPGSDPIYRSASKLQMMMRARRLGLNEQSATGAWSRSGATFVRARNFATIRKVSAPVVFRGTDAAVLNTLVARTDVLAIRLVSPRLMLAMPLIINRDHLEIDFGSTHVSMKGHAKFMVRVEGASDVRLHGGVFDKGPGAIVIQRSRNVLIEGAKFGALAGGGVLVTNSRDCVIWRNEFRHMGGAPVMLHGDTVNAVVANNDIAGNLNPSNWRAGIVLTDRNADLATDPDSMLNPDLYGVREDPIVNRVHIPHDNVIAQNDIVANQSSGIYSDGAVRNTIAGNRILRNSKEGICLDNGSTANIVAYNTFEANGKRWGKSDFELQREFVSQFGRLPDHTSPAKVPGVSMDNAAYNQVIFNHINENYGGGVKMVRSDYFNVVGFNTITDNNEGRNERFHFFGVELGSAKADSPVKDLDFTPSRGNVIFGNMIRGTHYAGIFFAEGSNDNEIIDNSIFNATNWAMEAVQRMRNRTLNNVSNEPSRNIDPGLDPKLGVYSAGRFD